MSDISPFALGYLKCALWSSTDNSRDDGGDPLDANYTIEDIDPTCRDRLIAEADAFEEAHRSDIIEAAPGHTPRAWVLENAGRDFWLTRNGHGAGFWDGDWKEPYAARLTEACDPYGTVDLYVGDDGRIYAMGYEP